MGVLAAAWTNDSCNESLEQDENLSVTDRIKKLIEEAVKEGFEQGREEARKEHEERLRKECKATEQRLSEEIKATEQRLSEEIKATEQTLIEEIKANEQRIKNAAHELSRIGYSNEKIARTLGFDQATIEAWLAEQRP